MIQLNNKEKKRQLDFYMLCKTFQESGVHTEEKALEYKERLFRNAMIQAAIVIIGGVLIALFFPQSIGGVLLFVTVLMLYICSFTYRGRTYLQRYIDEILKHPNFDPKIGGFPDVETPNAETPVEEIKKD